MIASKESAMEQENNIHMSEDDLYDNCHDQMYHAPHPDYDYTSYSYGMEDYDDGEESSTSMTMSDVEPGSSSPVSQQLAKSLEYHPYQPQRRQQRRNAVVSFDNIPRTVGGDTTSDTSSGPRPPCYAIAISPNVDIESGSGIPETMAGAVMDGISFSTVSCDDLNYLKKSEAADPAVDAVPSAFADPFNTTTGKTGSSTFRSRPGRKGRHTQEAETPTASMTGISPKTTTNNGHRHTSSSSPPRTHKAILRTKFAFFLFLLVVALVACGLLFTFLKTTEEQFAKNQFQSIAARAILDSADVVSRKRLSMATMSTMISETFRKESDWPNVSVVGFDRIVDMLAKTGSHTNMGFAPIVKLSEQQAFEDFAYDYFASRQDFPNTTGINSPDWRGVWRIQNGTRIHDADVSKEERQLLTPIIQCCIDNPGDRVLLFNLHSEPRRRKTIDGIIDCTKKVRASVLQVKMVSNVFTDDATTKATAEDSHTYPDYSCGSMTDFVKIVRFQTRGPASIMFQPVYPAEAPWEIRGLVLSPMAWDEVFEAVFSSNMNGVHAVLGSETKVHTYTIRNGRVESL
mmetsp:Transcript_21144/g.38798  ORF Transcript_21144/g.38798 Transcript_21144/m.38798 type:complete len:571 (+) Transcript_21144:3-1715(+)